MDKRILISESPTWIARGNGISRQRAFQLLHPERTKVSRKVWKAKQKGILIKPLACQECGKETAQLQVHHPDYKKALLVLWLCLACHKAKRKKTHNIPVPEGFLSFTKANLFLGGKMKLPYWIKKGEIPKYSFQGRKIYSLEDLEKVKALLISRHSPEAQEERKRKWRREYLREYSRGGRGKPLKSP